MKVGDRRTATLLGLVAVGAVGFAILQLLPSGADAGKQAASERSATSNAGVRDELPQSLSTDPFWHPSLVKSAAGSQSAPAGAVPPSISPFQPEAWGPGIPSGSLIADRISEARALAQNSRIEQELALRQMMEMESGGLEQGTGGRSGPPGAEPAKTAGPNRQLEQAIGVTLQVRATLRANGSTALISVNGADAQTFRAGDAIVPGLRLKTVDDRGVTLSTGKRHVRVEVGGEARL